MNSHFYFEGVNATYADYIQWARQLIRDARVDLSDKTPEQIETYINANAPSEFRQKSSARHGILLIHGLTSSPMGMSSLQDYFGSRHYLVRTLLLPGHGTRPGDLLEVTYQDWLESCRFALKTLREEVEHITVIAFSAGSALALYLSLTEASIDSLVLLAPALSLKNPLSSICAQLLQPFSQYFSKANWPILKKEDDYAKYQSIPLNAICQVTKLMKVINGIQHPLKLPLYMVSTIDDETISHQQAINFFLKQPNPLNRGIIYTANSDIQLPPSLTRRSSYFPQEKILDFSHISLAISPQHPHYGKNGDFADFSHYNPKKRPQKYQAHLVHLGSLSKKNLNKYLIQRLSYNSDFDYLAADIERFLEECFK